jgi:hypothetical protein
MSRFLLIFYIFRNKVLCSGYATAYYVYPLITYMGFTSRENLNSKTKRDYLSRSNAMGARESPKEINGREHHLNNCRSRNEMDFRITLRS